MQILAVHFALKFHPDHIKAMHLSQRVPVPAAERPATLWNGCAFILNLKQFEFQPKVTALKVSSLAHLILISKQSSQNWMNRNIELNYFSEPRRTRWENLALKIKIRYYLTEPSSFAKRLRWTGKAAKEWNRQKFWEKSQRKNPFSKGFVSTEQEARGKNKLYDFLRVLHFFVVKKSLCLRASVRE